MRQEFLDLYDHVFAAHRDVVERCVALERFVTGCAELPQLADLAYVLREAYEHADAARKELKKLDELVAKLFTMLWASDVSTGDSVKTDWCSATPNPKTHASVPRFSKDPEGYARVMRAIGVPAEVAEAGMVDLDWNGFAEYLTKKGTLPDGIDPGKTHVEHRLKIVMSRKLAERVAGRAQQQPREKMETEDDRHIPEHLRRDGTGSTNSSDGHGDDAETPF